MTALAAAAVDESGDAAQNDPENEAEEEKEDDTTLDEATLKETDLSVLEDGIYYGSGVGFGGTIKVAVTVADHQIKAIKIVSASGEDEPFFTKAKAMIGRILSAQSTKVDTVSGATYSSRGIREAVINALTGKVSNSKAGKDLEEASATAASKEAEVAIEEATEEDDAVYKDGTYTGEGTGFDGTIGVEVTIKGGEITKIRVTSYEGDGKWYIDQASEMIPEMIKNQTTNVDTVSGATYSSRGIIYAVRDALSKALTDPQKAPEEEEVAPQLPEREPSNKKPSNKKPSKNKDKEPEDDIVIEPDEDARYEDGIYEGKGTGFVGGTVTVQIEIKDGKIASVEVQSYQYDDEDYMAMAVDVIPKIIKTQTPAVDVVSGATYSSRGIMQAVADALSKAEKKEDASGDAGL
jgi:uncharacterized protein with FMN-binding domain